MSATPLTKAQLAAREAFKRAVAEGTDAGYPERVTLVPADDVDRETFMRTVGDNLRAGVPVVFVRDDGHEMMLAPAARTGVLGWIDKRLGRTRLHIAVRAGAFAPAVDRDQVVRLARDEELRRIVTDDLCTV